MQLDEADEPILFVLLIPFSGSWNVGHRMAGAAALAVERVNADKALLPRRAKRISRKRCAACRTGHFPFLVTEVTRAGKKVLALQIGSVWQKKK